MEAVLFVFFLFAFVLVAPPHIVVTTATGLLMSSLAVRSLARMLSGVKVGIAAAFRTLVLSFLLSMLASFTVMHVVLGAPPEFKGALTNVGANVLAYGAYALGFRFSLGLSWLHAAIVATLPALLIGLAVWLAISLEAWRSG